MSCEGCMTVSNWIGLQEAICLSSISTRELLWLAGQEEIHFSESGTTGQLLICRESLRSYLNRSGGM